MKNKNTNKQPQNGASKKEKEIFTQLPEEANKKEELQKVKPLAPLLHWQQNED